jgi:hypothetical protein
LNNEPELTAAPALARSQTARANFATRIWAWARTNDAAIALALALVCLITRLLAVPASLWEWDDMLFAHALHHYDLAAHHPHPPGFPVFVVLARAAYWVLKSEHLALGAVALIFGVLLGPALFYFFREIFRARKLAFAAALLTCFAPNVWVQGAAGRSDGPGLTVGVIALALALRGLQSRGALLGAGVLFGLGMGVRVTVLPVVAPTLAVVLLIRLWRREVKLMAEAVTLAALAALCWYVPLILHTTWQTYRSLMNNHAQFTWQTDSIFADTENAELTYRLTRFFGEVWGAPWIMWTIYALAALGVVALLWQRRSSLLGWLALAFLPFIGFVFILNTPLSAPLYSLPYIPLFTGLAACGLVLGPSLLPRAERYWVGRNLGLLLTIMLAIAFIEWTYPVIKMVHREASPSIRALEKLRATLDPQRDVVVFDGIFSPHVSFYLPQAKTVLQDANYKIEPSKADLVNPALATGRILSLTLEPVPGGEGEHLQWSSGRGARRLRLLSLGRYFDAYLTDLTDPQRIHFARTWGWYGEDGERSNWASPRAMVFLSPVRGAAQLQLTLRVPDQPDGTRSRIRLELANQVLDEFDPPPDWFVKTYAVPAVWHQEKFAQLTLVADRPYALPNGDERRIGMYARQIVWRLAQ